ncbi:hypothetical protein [Paludisphaera rhizosphaerae]|uniref:hypothetical protein n=1 Tax=Paludisphaera rhizosphaerae TaxID=2711216 RepID=UPI0013EA9ADA|nr:hypothetical protein [Paludisphaera rhizosphaerae]
MTPPAIAAEPDRPTTGPLVVGPVRGFWQTRDPGGWIWGALYTPLAAALAVDQLNRQVDDHLGIGMSVVLVRLLITAAAVGPMLLILGSSSWGEARWRIDDQGVSFAPPKGEPTFLAWPDVEQLKLADAIILRGRAARVTFSSTLPEPDRREVARRIHERLEADFDWEPRPIPRRTVGGFIRLLTTEATLLTAFVATTFGPAVIQQAGGPPIAWIGRIAFIVWLILLAASFVTRHKRAEDRRWISRRPAAPSL